MKKIMLVFLFGAGCFSVQGAQAMSPDLLHVRELIKIALSGKREALDNLQKFVEPHRALIEGNRKLILDSILWGDQTVQGILQTLDRRLLPAIKEIEKIVFPGLSIKVQIEKRSEEEMVALYIWEGLFRDMPYEIIESAYIRKPIDVDSNKFAIRAGRTIIATLGEEIDCENDRLIREQGGEKFSLSADKEKEILERRDRISALVRKERTGLSVRDFINLLDDCLIEAQPIKELENFITRHKKTLQARIATIRVDKKDLDQYLFDKNSLLYLKSDIYTALKPIGLEPSSRIALSEDMLRELAKKEVVQALRKSLEPRARELDFRKARYIYQKLPICVDEVDYDSRRTIGKALDTDARLSFCDEVRSLVSDQRMADPVELRKRVIAWFLNPQSAGLKEDVQEYINAHKKEAPTLRFDNGFEIGYDLFMNSCNRILFPKMAHACAAKHDKKRDLQFLKTLWKLSIDYVELLPLAKTAQENFQDAYKTVVDMYSIPYKGDMSVGDYLALNPQSEQRKIYDQIPKSRSKNSASGSKKAVVTRGSSSKQLIVVAVLSIAALIAYAYGQKTEKKAQVQVA